MVHNLSHHFSSDSAKDVFVENRKQHTLYKKKRELNSIYVEEVKSSLSNAFLQANLALAKDRNRGSFLRFFFRHLMLANAGDGRAVLCRNADDMAMVAPPVEDQV
ncbi:hypothetical protein F2Q70_00009410 [Brassica cretica]|uniref:PPM-type phosphatase domain-containing protein n=1 Tax=Brassica cretica TaxID=69181 RepID=A0A8S9LWL6_BRACR|nr:hypothetical protein F2Q70_00009410 [Brassica cretica]